MSLSKLLNLPITEEVGPELAQSLLMLTFLDSLGRIHFHGEGLKVDTFFRLNGFVHLVFFPLIAHFGALRLLVLEKNEIS